MENYSNIRISPALASVLQKRQSETDLMRQQMLAINDAVYGAGAIPESEHQRLKEAINNPSGRQSEDGG